MSTLVYVDPSPRGEWALALAAQLPALGRTGVCLLATGEDMAADPELLSRAGTRLGLAASVALRCLPGPAERAVAAAAAEQAWELIVVPPAGRNALQRLLRGSRVASVVRSVRAPVLVARRPPPRVERVLAGLSGGPSSQAVCRHALGLAAELGAHVAFLHVVARVELPSRSGAGAAAPRPDPAEAARASLREHGYGGELLLRQGLAVEELLAEFDAGAYHLLVVGAQSAEDAADRGREDLTQRLLLGCRGSVLVVPRP